MRHKVAGRKLRRKTQHRRAMWRNMAVSLFTHGQITTTIPKAKSVKPLVERLITAAKKGDLASRRRVLRALGSDRLLVRAADDDAVDRNRYGEISNEARAKAPRVVKKLFDEIAPRYADRDGGYTRIIKLARHRVGDGTQLCVLQLVGEDEGGPQVSGQYSRRREKANRRMERAAAARKAVTGAHTGDQAGGDAATAVAEPQADEAPAEQPGADEPEKDEG
jgi:large subunit ribosomal protein L17